MKPIHEDYQILKDRYSNGQRTSAQQAEFGTSITPDQVGCKIHNGQKPLRLLKVDGFDGRLCRRAGKDYSSASLADFTQSLLCFYPKLPIVYT